MQIYVKQKIQDVDNFKSALNYDEIRRRIELDKNEYSKTSKDWAIYIGVEESAVSNFHRKKDPRKPSFEYVLAVAYKTQKPAEWYLYGHPDPEPAMLSEPQKPYMKDANRPSFCDSTWSDDDIRHCKQLKKILDSKHPVIVPAIISNLAAFEHSVTSEKERTVESDDLKAGMKKKSNEIKELKKRILHLEALTDPAGRYTGTDEAE